MSPQRITQRNAEYRRLYDTAREDRRELIEVPVNPFDEMDMQQRGIRSGSRERAHRPAKDESPQEITIMPSFDTAGKEVSDLAERIIEEHHPDLHELLLNGNPQAPALKIDFVLVQSDLDGEGHPKGPAIKHQGYPALGLCKIVNLHDRSVSERGDVEIQLDASHWGDIGDEEREALLAHEINHIVPMIDRESGEVKRDDLGRVRVRMRKHDYQFGWFTQTAVRYGEASVERQQARSIFNRDGEAFFPFLAELDAQNQARTLTGMAADVASAMVDRCEKAGGTVTISGAGKSVTMASDELANAAKSVKVFMRGQPKEFATSEDAANAIIDDAAAQFGKPRKKREPFVQPPGMVNVAGKEEHCLVLDLSGVETVSGITPLFRAAYKRAKWSDESATHVLNFCGDDAAALKRALEHYTYQPEKA